MSRHNSVAPVDTSPGDTLWRLFCRFLRFGSLAWGGPVAQIAMIRDELVDRDRWITAERFNRVLAVYQALPGPEAHELCVYFGMVARGRTGGLLAGLGFMLPGFCLMLVLSWAYVRWGIATPIAAAAFLGCQPAVAAIVLRAVHRIGTHAVRDRALLAIAIAVGAATLVGVSFFVTLPLAGIAYAVARGGMALPALFWSTALGAQAALVDAPSALTLLGYGLRSGLLTFGGAYTVLPFLQHDAVVRGAWMTNAQFLDGIALSGMLPAPLVIVATFVGYVGGGTAGAIAMTAGVFLPAFAFTLVGHRYVERLVENTAAHAFLDGITAGVVGLIAVTALGMARATLTSPVAWGIFAAALLTAFMWRSRYAVVAIMLGAAVAGILASRM